MKKPVVALALGAGSARGLAHIGVVKVLEKNNIPIDLITGTSMGAIIGAFYAKNKDILDVERIALSINNKKLFKLLDPSLSMGFFRGNKVINFLKDNLGDVEFKDLKIPLVVVATNTRNGESVYFDRGDLVNAIRGSISIPLLFSPYSYKGLSLIDGHLSEPVPVNAALSKKPDVVIAVNLDSKKYLRNDMSPSFGGIAKRTVRILFYHLSKSISEKADVVISPDIDIDYFASFSEASHIIKQGELAAKKALPSIRKVLREFENL
ncbi:patatin-like phospholipase family protein [Candidatus Woesearchaeota archaeon]|nr:patatin-like phospholipase family protein [Candidatus Woesearchaeota archaeon]